MQQVAEDIALEHPDFAVKAQVDKSPHGFERGEDLAGWSEPGVGFSFSFSSRWHLSARKGPYALRLSAASPRLPLKQCQYLSG